MKKKIDMQICHENKWAASRQNQHSAFVTSMDPDQPAHPRRLIRIHAQFAISFSTCYRVCKRTAWILIRLDTCWSQTHYVGFVVTWLKCFPICKRANILFHFPQNLSNKNTWKQKMCNWVRQSPEMELAPLSNENIDPIHLLSTTGSCDCQ
jgi:hypothetical protein